MYRSWSTLKKLIYGKMFANGSGGTEIWRTITAAIATFTAVAAPLRQLSVAVEPVQSGTGDPSPTNVRPITGWDSVTVNRTGVNVWDEEWELGGINNQNGTLWTATDRIRSKNFIPCLPNTGYYLKCPQMVSAVVFYDADNTFISALANFAGNATFTTPSNAKYIKFGVAGAYGPAYNNDISINYPATDTEYHAYQGNEYTIQLGETVYGGTLDVVNGKMTVDRRFITIDGNSNIGKEATGWANNYEAFYLNISDNVGKNVGVTATPNIISNQLKTASYNTLRGSSGSAYSITFTASGSYLEWLSTSATLTEEKARITNNPIEVCYELATPFELTLTPEQISTLQGTNNVWSDAGDVTVTYRAQ